ncbi:telomere repeat-binding protein 4-like [Dorcoceras hygrometricum]|uniref:Telomere repeat-binding protein 4-like n=1 Tax=Dorcoceras hygrometricum TaxID=472368 RepID=A0A2Z7BS13_9LAMI|nr:telomere repeat-binding protein 4-like [Dorcoceras hygrometricum]
MVSKKRLNDNFNGFQVPVVPRAPRSIRRKGRTYKKLVEDNELCPFELLAAVAGKLLQESESSACSNAGEGKGQLGIGQYGLVKGQHGNHLKSEGFDHRSCAESAFVPEVEVQDCNLLSNLEGFPSEGNAPILECSSVLAGSGLLKNVNSDIKLGFNEVKADKMENGPESQSDDNKNHINDVSVAPTSIVKDPIAESVNTDVLVNADSNVQLPLYRDPIAGDFLNNHWNNVKLGNSDDDEYSFGCSKSSTKIRSFRPQPWSGNRRIRKILASKYWKASPKLKDYDVYNTSERLTSFYRYRKNIYARERYQRAPIKKRKLYGHPFTIAYDQEASGESTSSSPDKRASELPATVKGHQKVKDSRVKFSIKSFRVPELYIEVPETTTVGSLKRTVLKAVTTILGGGIRVGVVLQGKKVRDENRTLQQAGISESCNLDTLGFTLEPSFTNPSSMTPKKLPLALPYDADQQFPRSPITADFGSGISSSSDIPVVTKLDSSVDNRKPISSLETPTNELTDGSSPDSKALVPVDPMNVESLALVPVDPKHKRGEVSQRRTRRPFSVSEVEALVEAVENLGTGRWRDVKKRAFENADHRTYVDLKDKWKTLVHTASISPQQRRGEPVPQDLLNRVLSAHSYWSQHQCKQQHGKNSVERLKIVDGVHGEMVGA